MKKNLFSGTPIRYGMTLAVILLFLCGLVSALPRGIRNSSPDNTEPLEIGMIALLASPEKYDGKLVRTTGFLCIEFEGNALYLHEEDYRHRLTKNAMRLELSKQQEIGFKNLSVGHVIIEGKISAQKWGVEHGMYSGSIGNVTRLELWRPRGDMPAEKR